MTALQTSPVAASARATRPGRLTGLLVVLAVLLAAAGASLLTVELRHRPAPAAVPGPVDVGFAQDMAVHHAQALLMAGIVEQNSTDPALVALARQITVEQATERGMLTGWLSIWQAPQLPDGPPMTWMPGAAMGPGDTMPGMATQRQLDALAAARGTALRTQFLTLMIAHHEGGIEMADDAAQHADLPQVRGLAARSALEEQQEVATMQALLG